MGHKSFEYASKSSDEALEKGPQESAVIESFEEEYEDYLQLKVRQATFADRRCCRLRFRHSMRETMLLIVG